jgi:hypothetical protein
MQHAKKLSRAYFFRRSDRTLQISGTPWVCSNAAACRILTGKPNLSLGCDGSKKFFGFSGDEIVMGILDKMLQGNYRSEQDHYLCIKIRRANTSSFLLLLFIIGDSSLSQLHFHVLSYFIIPKFRYIK